MTAPKAALALMPLLMPPAVAREISPQTSECTLLAELTDQPVEEGASYKSVPLTSDAGIVVGAQVRRGLSASCPFAEGDRVQFLLHSPSLTVGGYWWHGAEVFITLARAPESSGREWSLEDLTISRTSKVLPFPGNQLECEGSNLFIRVLVGSGDRTMFGPLSIQTDRRPLISLSTTDVARSNTDQSSSHYEIDYEPSDDSGPLRRAFHLLVEGPEGTLRIGNDTYSLKCEWPEPH